VGRRAVRVAREAVNGTLVSSEGGGLGREVVGSELTPPPGPARGMGAPERQSRSTMSSLFLFVGGRFSAPFSSMNGCARGEEARGRSERRGARRPKCFGGISGPPPAPRSPPPWPRHALERARARARPAQLSCSYRSGCTGPVVRGTRVSTTFFHATPSVKNGSDDGPGHLWGRWRDR
jgi:hypothetical protein